MQKVCTTHYVVSRDMDLNYIFFLKIRSLHNSVSPHLFLIQCHRKMCTPNSSALNIFVVCNVNLYAFSGLWFLNNSGTAIVQKLHYYFKYDNDLLSVKNAILGCSQPTNIHTFPWNSINFTFKVLCSQDECQVSLIAEQVLKSKKKTI